WIFSLGQIGGLRTISYHLLPLMDSFRHPSNARLFSIFFACMLAGFTLSKLLKNPELNNRIKKTNWYLLVISFTFLFLIAIAGNPNFFLNGLPKEGLKTFLDNLDFHDLLLINIIIQIPFLVAFYLFYIKKLNLNFLLIITIINLVLL